MKQWTQSVKRGKPIEHTFVVKSNQEDKMNKREMKKFVTVVGIWSAVTTAIWLGITFGMLYIVNLLGG